MEAAIPLASQAQLCGTPGKDGVGNPTGIINTYYPGTASVAAGATSIPVGAPTGSGTPISAGDLLLVIQMQSAIINSTNTSSYGNGSTGAGYTALNGAGQFEYVVATGPVAGGVVPIQGANGGGLVNSYLEAPYSGTQGQETYQVVRVPQYSSATVNNGLTASYWNGSTGGILAMDVAGPLNLNNATASVDGEGFRGGGSRNLNGGSGGVTSDMATVSTLGYYDSKGEGIAGTPRYVFDPVGLADIDTGVEGYPGGSFARGAPGNAGGGGTDSHPIDNGNNSGGGGGGNGGAGGQGGNSFYDNYPVGGLGGATYPSAANQMVLGGGGGAGDQNNSSNGQSSGGAGGGMIFVRACSVTGTGTFSANGFQGVDTTALDAAGGGGAGGSVLVATASGNLSGLTVNAMGGRGGNDAPSGPIHGPGGGGGGGVAILSSGAGVLAVGGGVSGLSDTLGTPTNYNAQPGQAGTFNYSLNPSQVPGAQLCGCVISTPTNTSTPTPTPTPLLTATNTPTATPSMTPTLTPTPTATLSPTNSPTQTPSSTPTFTLTQTPTGTPTNTGTPTATFTPSSTPTLTSTLTPSGTPTLTQTSSATSTASFTPTVTATFTATSTPTNTATPTASATQTLTRTNTSTATVTFTPTVTSTWTATSTTTNTATLTASATPTSTRTHTSTATPSFTPTNSPTPTPSSTPTSTHSPCGYPGFTCTPTPTPPTADIFEIFENILRPSQGPVTIFVDYTNFPGPYSLRVYNSAGEHIRTLDDHYLNAPVSQYYSWDGTNKYGDACANGVYILYLVEPYGAKLKRVLLVR